MVVPFLWLLARCRFWFNPHQADVSESLIRQERGGGQITLPKEIATLGSILDSQLS